MRLAVWWWCASRRGVVRGVRDRRAVWARSRRRMGGDLLVQLTVHHVAFDGASTGVFLGELRLMYERDARASSSSSSSWRRDASDGRGWCRGRCSDARSIGCVWCDQQLVLSAAV